MGTAGSHRLRAHAPDFAMFVAHVQKRSIMTQFSDLGLSSDALKAVVKLGYEDPTPVQEQAIPVVLEGRDLIAAASTGTGKTAAFLLPLLSKLERAGRGKRNPRVLVVTPTRELAQQIAFTCIKIARATGHFATTVYGGTPYGPQIKELRGGTDILIATPGRLNDLMKRDVVKLSSIEALVLDEADRMLDMGFLPDVKTIVEALPEQRQTLLFSATIDQSIENNLGSLLNDPAIVQIAHKGETAATVEQFIMPIAHRNKFELLKAVLEEKGHERVIIFARTKNRTEECADALVEAGYSAESIHSDKTQGRRRRALENFRRGRTDILVATDVLARGIDVTGVDHVINYDLPDMAEDYVHRIGRTGRAGEQGYAISFVSPNSRKLLKEIEELIGREIPVMKLESYDINPDLLKKSAKKRRKTEKKRDKHSDERAARYKQRREEERSDRARRKGGKKRDEDKPRDAKFEKTAKDGERKHSGKRRDAENRNGDRLGGKRGAKRHESIDRRDRDGKGSGKKSAKTSYRSKHGADHRGRKASGDDVYAGKSAKKGKKAQSRPANANDIRAFGERKLSGR